MNAMTRVLLIAAAALLVGYLLGNRIAGRNYAQLQDRLILSQASFETSSMVGLLTLHREGKADVAAGRMEILLDKGIIDLARAYSRQADPEGGAARTLERAATYRAAHPYRSEREAEVKAALASVAEIQR